MKSKRWLLTLVLLISGSLTRAQYFLSISAPASTTVGPPSSFTVTISVLDANNGNQVISQAQIVGSPNITLTAKIGGAAGHGSLMVTSVPLSAPTVSFYQAYTAAEQIELSATVTVNPSSAAAAGITSAIAFSPGPYVKVLSLYPGETAVAIGNMTATGKTGTPNTQTLNQPFTVVVDAVDAYWNIVTNAAGTASVASTPAGLLSGTLSQAFTNGAASFSVAVTTPIFNLTMTSSDSANAGITPQSDTLNVTGNYVFAVTVPASATAGSNFNVQIELLDQVSGNPTGPGAIPTPNPTITLTVLEGGSAGPGTAAPATTVLNNYNLTYAQSYTRAAAISIKAQATINGKTVTGTSSVMTINPGTYTKVLMLMPGETATTPGVPNAKGKTGGPPAYFLQGSAFSVNVYAVDTNWNVVTSPAGGSTAFLDTNPSGYVTGTHSSAYTNGVAGFSVAFATSGYNVGMTASDSVTGGITTQTDTVLVYPGPPQYVVTVPAVSSMTPVTFPMSVALVNSNNNQTINFATNTFTLSVAGSDTPSAANWSLGATVATLAGGTKTIAAQNASRTGFIQIQATDNTYGFTGLSQQMAVYPENHYYQITIATYTVFGVALPTPGFEVTRIDATNGLPVARTRTLAISAYFQGGVPITSSAPASIDLTSTQMTTSPQTYIQTFRDPNQFITGTTIYFMVQPNLDGDGLSTLSTLSTTSALMVVQEGPINSVAASVSAPLLFLGGTANVQGIVRDTPEGHRIPNVPMTFSITQGTGSVNPTLSTTNAQGAATTVLQTVNAQQDQIYVVQAQVLGPNGVTISSSVVVKLALPPVTTLTTNGLAVITSDQILRVQDVTSIGLTATSVVGISSIAYQLDGGAWTIYAGTFTLPVGFHTLSFYATDTFGLNGPVGTQQIQVAFSNPVPTGALINYPNPFRAGKESTILEYSLSQSSGIRLRIFNLLGQLVYDLTVPQGGTGTATGVNQLVWDGHNSAGNLVGNGGYIAVIQVSETGERWTRKIAVVK